MKIVFNQKIFFLQKQGGISRYICSLIEEFIKSNLNVKVISPLHKNIYLKNIPKKYASGYYFKRYPIIKYLDNFFENYFNTEIKKILPDIIHDTYYTGNIIKTPKAKKIITVHDLIHEKYKHLYEKNCELLTLKSKAFKNADHFICVSKNTKKDLIDIYNIDENKISVIYHGSDHLRFDNNNNIDTGFNYKPYLLYVGERGKYKNFIKLLEVLSSSEKLKEDFNLICFGGKSFSNLENKKILSLKLSKNIFQISGDDNLLKKYYANARAFIFPSLYEGFGIPLLEAMNSNCPIFCSNISAFSEVCEHAAIFFNPNDNESILNQIISNIYDEDRLSTLKSNGNKRSREFTWDKTAKQTYNLYKSLVTN